MVRSKQPTINKCIIVCVCVCIRKCVIECAWECRYLSLCWRSAPTTIVSASICQLGAFDPQPSEHNTHTHSHLKFAHDTLHPIPFYSILCTIFFYSHSRVIFSIDSSHDKQTLVPAVCVCVCALAVIHKQCVWERVRECQSEYACVCVYVCLYIAL